MSEWAGLFHADVFFKFAAALIALINPLYGIPIFLGMTEGFSQAERRRTASIIALTILIASAVVTFVGEEILAFFGITVPAFQIAGGLIVLGIGLSMIKDATPGGADSTAAEAGQRSKSIAIVPLSIPLTFGPGSFATIIMFAHLLGDGAEAVTMTPVIIAVSLSVWLGLWYADSISRALGDTVISVVTRVMAIILTAVAIEMIGNGAVQFVHDNFSELTGHVGGG